ncbi:MAG: hypothetical protein KC502_06710 [Myxococcales bacterium]|nr:hypothetical protein [Myxococcales bacterium]
MRDVLIHTPKRLQRREIRRRSLRAATAVAVGAALGAGCGSADMPVAGTVFADVSHDGGGALDGGGRAQPRYPDKGADLSGADAGFAQADTAPRSPHLGDALAQTGDAGAGDGGGTKTDSQVADTGSLDAGTPSSDAGVQADAGLGDDANRTRPKPDLVCDSKGDWATYKHCCDANGWDWNKGCMAWGPPAPPTLSAGQLAGLMSAFGVEVRA